MSQSQQLNVLMVCLGNICRSPTAQGVLEARLEQAGLQHQVRVDSAGTAAWHTGKAPDPRSQQVALQRGYTISHLRARQATREDFEHFDYVLAMDADNLNDLRVLEPAHYAGELKLLLDYAFPGQQKAVPDPYYTQGDAGFHQVVDLIEQACDGLIEDLKKRLKAT
ncbi:Low molecular weight protein tyrosine phosphatase [Nitrincola lacisaponensis]|uniref:protein-tyrosine-phosphatase n=1 Tax=Nitrincola lacisaponensis TaxID=267850 RepID=A0A063Y010_9GAMM|nr:low molecular weight protein-tyrosine-phosphatase [Nitrincola lacisaponensis]KDE38485.1 Low molecular weight protein tyrosine phosphatase [Nitrincola lacisaponensis]